MLSLYLIQISIVTLEFLAEKHGLGLYLQQKKALTQEYSTFLMVCSICTRIYVVLTSILKIWDSGFRHDIVGGKIFWNW